MSHKDAPPETPSQVACREFWQREQPHINRAWGQAKDGSYFAEHSRLLHKSWVTAAAERDAEIEALRAEVAAWRELSDHVRAGACNAIWPDRYTDARTRDVAAALKRAEQVRDWIKAHPAEAQAQGGGEVELRHMVAKLAAHVRPTCGELWAEAERLLNRTASPSAPVGVEGLVAMYREAFISERARNYRAEGMGVEQARIHAEADVNAAEAALSAEPVGREAVAWRIVREDGSRSKWKDMPPRKLRPVDGKGARIEFAYA